MKTIRRSEHRGHADHGWLKSHHTFSFAEYRDPNHMGFRTLRVINEDRVAAGQGIGTHAHHDMEIVSYVLSGALEHKDSMGHGEILRPGEFQRISAGKGITHSEFNPSQDEPTHFYQIWLLPAEKGLEPSYEQRNFAAEGRANQWQLVASPDPQSDALTIHQDAHIFLADLQANTSIQRPLAPNRYGWLQILRGQVMLEDSELAAGDGVAIEQETEINLTATTHAEIMYFDLA